MSELPDTPCPHCGKIVKELSRHIKRSHEKLTCDLCGKLVPPGNEMNNFLRENAQVLIYRFDGFFRRTYVETQ